MAEFNMMEKAEGAPMPPQQTFTTALVYMTLADDKISTDEIGEILSLVRSQIDGSTMALNDESRDMLARAIEFARTHPLSYFLEITTPALSDSQRMEILKNLIEVSLADGKPQEEELDVFRAFLHAYGISPERFQPDFGRLHLDECTYLQ